MYGATIVMLVTSEPSSRAAAHKICQEPILNMFNLFENIKGFPLKAKSFRNTATYSKLWGGVPLIKIKTV